MKLYNYAVISRSQAGGNKVNLLTVHCEGQINSSVPMHFKTIYLAN